MRMRCPPSHGVTLMHRSRWSCAVALVLVVSLSACTTWSRQSNPPAQVVTSHPGALVRVTRTDHSVVTVRGARVVNDSLVGTTNDAARLPVSIAVSDVESIDTREVSGARTAGLGAGALLGIIAIAGIAAALAVASLGREL